MPKGIYRRTEKTIENMRKRRLDDKTRKKISISMKGKFSGKKHPMYGKKHSPEALKKLTRNNIRNGKKRRGIIPKNLDTLNGKNHWNWKGGIAKIDKLCRVMKEYKQWRSDVFQRDRWTCKTCGKNRCYVTAHHIKAFSKIIKESNIKQLSQARKCKELWDIDNGVTLCEDCHKLTDNYKGRVKNN